MDQPDPDREPGLRREGLEGNAFKPGVVARELPRLEAGGDHGLDGGHEPVLAEGGEGGVPVDTGHLRIPAKEVPGALNEEGAKERDEDEDDQHLDEGEAELSPPGGSGSGPDGNGRGAPQSSGSRTFS